MESKNIESGVHAVLTMYATFFFFKERNQVLEVSISVLMNDDGVLEFFSARERNVFEVLLLGSSPSTNINMLNSISMLYILWRILFFSCS